MTSPPPPAGVTIVERWDKNLVGFRGEAELGIHAGTAVSVGAFQLLTSAIA